MNPMLTIAVIAIVLLVGYWCLRRLKARSVNYKKSDVTENLAACDETDDFEFNQDYQRRDRILGIQSDWNEDENGGIENFKYMDVSMLKTLLTEKFIESDCYQNESPTVKDIYQFMQRHPQVIAFGYAVSPERDDYRVSIEGLYVTKDNVTPVVKRDFLKFCKSADELEKHNGLYAWWD